MLLSVIIPTLNRSKLLSDLLDSLAVQEPVSFTWEILVVDNASSDDTKAVVQKIIPLMPVPLRYVYESKPGLHQGRHRGARESNGELIAYLDDDMVLAPGWISGLELLLSKQADVVVSRILPKWEAPPPEWITDLFDGGTFGLLGLLDLGNEPRQIDPLTVWGGGCFIRRSLVFKLGGFHPDGMPPELLRYRGDGETGFFRKFKAQGYRAWYDPRSVTYHRISQKRMTIEYLTQRSYNQGISGSYSQIRKAAGLGVAQVSSPGGINRISLYHFGRWVREISFADSLKWLSNRVQGVCRRLLPTKKNKIKRQLYAANRAGWKFHQSAVLADPELFDYVLKDSYLE
jgi:glucosyl-dolichyl phosphate glucuronosyltransferase